MNFFGKNIEKMAEPRSRELTLRVVGARDLVAKDGGFFLHKCTQEVLQAVLEHLDGHRQIMHVLRAQAEASQVESGQVRSRRERLESGQPSRVESRGVE